MGVWAGFCVRWCAGTKIPRYSRSGTYRCSARGYDQQPTHTLSCEGLKSWGERRRLESLGTRVDAAAVALYVHICRPSTSICIKHCNTAMYIGEELG